MTIDSPPRLPLRSLCPPWLRSLATSLWPALLLVGLVGCGSPEPSPEGTPTQGAATLEEVAHPDLSALSQAVRDHLSAQRETLASLESDPEASDEQRSMAYGKLGQLYQAYEFRQAARTCYQNATRLGGGEARWSYLLGLMQLAEGQGDTAKASLQRARELEPESLATVVRLAEIALGNDDVEAARELFEQAAELDEGEAISAFGLGRVATATGDDTLAIEHLERALELQPEAKNLHYLLAVAKRRQGDEAAAEAHLAEMDSGDVEYPDPWSEQVEGLGTGVGILSEAAIDALAEGRIDEAVAKYREAVALENDSPTALRGLALALRTGGRFDESAQVLRDMLAIYPDHSLATMELGTVLMEKGDLAPALEAFDRALEIDPEFPVARLNRAVTLERSGRADEAIAELRRVLEIDEGHQRARLNLATLLARMGRTPEALAEAREAIRREPGLAEPRQKLGDLLLQGGDPVAAEEQYRSILGLEGLEGQDRSLAHYQLGRLATSQGDHEAALAAYQQARGSSPSFWQAGLAEGNALLRLERFDEAASAYQEVIRANPSNAVAHAYRAEALMRAGRWSDARAGLEQGLRDQPNSGELAHLLARLLAIAPDPQLRDGQRALDLAGQIFQAQPSVDHAETVVMAMAEVGRFDEAISWQEKLVPRARQDGRQDLLPRLQANLERYRQRLPARSN